MQKALLCTPAQYKYETMGNPPPRTSAITSLDRSLPFILFTRNPLISSRLALVDVDRYYYYYYYVSPV